MALSKAKIREILSKAGVEAEAMAEAVDKITDGHVASIEALKEERDIYKADSEKLEAVQKELEDLKKTVDDDNGFEKKYNDIKKEFDDYKQTKIAEEEKKAKENAYRSMLKEIGVLDKRIDSIMKVTSLDDIHVDGDGNIEGIDELKETAKEEWSDFIGKPEQRGANENNPPANDTEPPKKISRAAQLEQKYHGDVYGKAPKDND